MLLLETTTCRLRRSIFCYVYKGRLRGAAAVRLHALNSKPRRSEYP